MSTIRKTAFALGFAVLIGIGVYEVNRASRMQQQMAALQEREASLGQQLARFTMDNQNLSNQLARANQGPAIGTERLRELLRLRGEVALLRRRQGELEQALAKANEPGSKVASGAQPMGLSPFQVQLVLDGPAGDSQSMTNDSSGSRGEILQVQKTPLADYTIVRSASIAQESASGSPVINIEFSPEGQELFAAVTRENINKRVAIVLDGRVFSAPVIRSEVTGGQAQITGNFSEEEARALVAKINDAIPRP